MMIQKGPAKDAGREFFSPILAFNLAFLEEEVKRTSIRGGFGAFYVFKVQ